MNKEQERACIDNTQSYVDKIYGYGDKKSCHLCRVFVDCDKCPLGHPDLGRFSMVCINDPESNSSHFWNPSKIRSRLKFLLKKYKDAGLEIVIE